jgi:hypothetical protein
MHSLLLWNFVIWHCFLWTSICYNKQHNTTKCKAASLCIDSYIFYVKEGRCLQMWRNSSVLLGYLLLLKAVRWWPVLSSVHSYGVSTVTHTHVKLNFHCLLLTNANSFTICFSDCLLYVFSFLPFYQMYIHCSSAIEG